MLREPLSAPSHHGKVKSFVFGVPTLRIKPCQNCLHLGDFFALRLNDVTA